MIFSKKRTLIPFALLLICILARGLFIYTTSIAPLDSFCKELSMELLQDNPFELHYTIAHPEDMGLAHLSNNLVPFSMDSYMQSEPLWLERAEMLQRIKPEALPSEDILTYELLSRYVSLQTAAYDFPYYENPISVNSGVQGQLPILLTEYTLRSEADVQNYFTLLSQIPAYFEGIASYCAAQEQQGIFLYNGSLQKVKEQCLTLFPGSELKNGTHFLQTSFHDRLQELASAGLLSEKQIADYEAQNTALLKTKLVPAYESLAAAVHALTGSEKLRGLASYPNGSAYYALLLSENTGSSKSVDEIKNMLFERYDMLFEKYKTLLSKRTEAALPDFFQSDPAEGLKHLNQKTSTCFPPLSGITGNTSQKLFLKQVSDALSETSAPAFYMTPPIDANAEHTIYINPDAKMDTLDLYTTLAHEGFPGHLYQTVYSQTALTNEHAPLFRQLLYYGGFTEGWAVYAELYSYDFLTELCDSSQTDLLALRKLNREIQLCLCSILDIYIHYDNATLSDVAQLLKTLGLNNASAEDIYAVICDAPANYPKYYVGYLEILNLKEQARELWGDTYSDYAYHKWLLTSGPADFEALNHKLVRDCDK